MEVLECSHRPILVPCSLKNFDLQVDPYIGCEHHCHYCYALNQAESDWQEEIFIHKDVANQLKKELEKVAPQKVYMGYYTDPYQPSETEYRQTRKVLELLLAGGFSVSILTKSDLVTRDMDLLQDMEHASISVSVAFNKNRVREQFEANTKDTEARIEALRELREVGIRTSALICPVIPYITDVIALIEMLASHADAIWLYGLSIEKRSDRNWQNVQGILHTHFPDVKEKIETVLFTKQHSYWTELRQQLTELQRESELDLRIYF